MGRRTRVPPGILATTAPRKTRSQRGHAGSQELTLRHSLPQRPGRSSCRRAQPRRRRSVRWRQERCGSKLVTVESRYGRLGRRAPRPKPTRASPQTCWDEMPTPVEVTAPDHESARALLREALEHFHAELVETDGAAPVVRLRPAGTASAVGCSSCWRLSSAGSAHTTSSCERAPWESKLRDHGCHTRKRMGRRSRTGRRLVADAPDRSPASAGPDREREARPGSSCSPRS